MLTTTNGGSFVHALRTLGDTPLGRLLVLRRDQLGGDISGLAHFVVVQSGDSVADVERALGFSPFQSFDDCARFPDPEFVPAWEWIEDRGFCFELCFILDDSGFAHVLFIENREGVASELLDLCRAWAFA